MARILAIYTEVPLLAKRSKMSKHLAFMTLKLGELALLPSSFVGEK